MIPVIPPTCRPPRGFVPSTFVNLQRGWLPLEDVEGTPIGHVALVDPVLAAEPEQAGYALGRTAPAGMAAIRSGPEVVDGPGVAWMPDARARFDAFAAGFERAVATRPDGCFPAVWPHSHGAVSDAPSIQAFMRGRHERGWRFVLDPAALVTPSMMPLLEDHLCRLLDLLGDHPAACLLIEDEATGRAWPSAWRREAGDRVRPGVPRLRRPPTPERDSYTGLP